MLQRQAFPSDRALPPDTDSRDRAALRLRWPTRPTAANEPGSCRPRPREPYLVTPVSLWRRILTRWTWESLQWAFVVGGLRLARRHGVDRKGPENGRRRSLRVPLRAPRGTLCSRRQRQPARPSRARTPALRARGRRAPESWGRGARRYDRRGSFEQEAPGPAGACSLATDEHAPGLRRAWLGHVRSEQRLGAGPARGLSVRDRDAARPPGRPARTVRAGLCVLAARRLTFLRRLETGLRHPDAIAISDGAGSCRTTNPSDGRMRSSGGRSTWSRRVGTRAVPER